MDAQMTRPRIGLVPMRGLSCVWDTTPWCK